MAETVIWMDGAMHQPVVRGEKKDCWRPGHREYQEGPATIQFITAMANARPVDIMITEVRHTRAEAMTLSFVKALERLGYEPVGGDKVTYLTWEVV